MTRTAPLLACVAACQSPVSVTSESLALLQRWAESADLFSPNGIVFQHNVRLLHQSKRQVVVDEGQSILDAAQRWCSDADGEEADGP